MVDGAAVSEPSRKSGMPHFDRPLLMFRQRGLLAGGWIWFVPLVCLMSLGAVAAAEFSTSLPVVAEPPPSSTLWGASLLPDRGSSMTASESDATARDTGGFAESGPVTRADRPPAEDPWTLQVMPLGLLYRSYLAGAKEPRIASYWSTDRTIGTIWDPALGGRLGLLRYGTQDVVHPEGWQVDLEGGVQTRLDPRSDSTPLLSADFRVGVPITWAQGCWQFKTGYYHISSHLGDEFLLANPQARRINYTRDGLLLGVGHFWTERLRLYGEVGCAIAADGGAEPWEFQFGADWAPAQDTGLAGAPFWALNAQLREEVDFGGNFVVQAGWAWRRFPRGSLFRVGVEYFNGHSDQYEYFDYCEQRIGGGIWADF